MKKAYILILIMSICFLFGLCACNNDSDEGDNPPPEQGVVLVDEGTCGETATWELMSDGVITISGTGAMNDFDIITESQAPWKSHESSIKKVIVEQGITKIGDYAFFAFDNLTEIKLPYGLEEIGDSAFYDAKTSTLTIPHTVTTIGDTALCIDTLTTLEIPYKVSSLGVNAVRSKNMQSYTVASSSNYFSAKDGVLYNYLGTKIVAYPGAKDATVYVIPEDVTTVGSNAFFECDKLASIVVSPNLQTIEDGGFRSCPNITSLTIPDGVESLGLGTFDGCTNLSSIHIGAGVLFISGTTFSSCNLSSITVSPDNQFYIVSGGKLYSKDMMTLVYYPCNLPGETYAIPYGVKNIGSGCFYAAKHLTNIDIPETVTHIGYMAFEYTDITRIYIPKSVVDIGFSAFSGCEKLTTVNYGGAASDWIKITIGDWNSILLQATRNYNFIND